MRLEVLEGLRLHWLLVRVLAGLQEEAYRLDWVVQLLELEDRRRQVVLVASHRVVSPEVHRQDFKAEEDRREEDHVRDIQF